MGVGCNRVPDEKPAKPEEVMGQCKTCRQWNRMATDYVMLCEVCACYAAEAATKTAVAKALNGGRSVGYTDREDSTVVYYATAEDAVGDCTKMRYNGRIEKSTKKPGLYYVVWSK